MTTTVNKNEVSNLIMSKKKKKNKKVNFQKLVLCLRYIYFVFILSQQSKAKGSRSLNIIAVIEILCSIKEICPRL